MNKNIIIAVVIGGIVVIGLLFLVFLLKSDSDLPGPTQKTATVQEVKKIEGYSGNVLAGNTTPFIETHRKQTQPEQYKIKGIYFLHQALKNKVIRQTDKQAIHTLLANSYIYQNSTEDKFIHHYFETGVNIVKMVDTFNLYFTNSADFLELID